MYSSWLNLPFSRLNLHLLFCEGVYIHKQSNHPPNILKELPKRIKKRISDISYDKNLFNKAKLTYKKALNNGGFTEMFSNIKPGDQNITNREAKRKRKRKIIWYNPPLSLNVNTNVGKRFFKYLERTFQKLILCQKYLIKVQ